MEAFKKQTDDFRLRGMTQAKLFYMMITRAPIERNWQDIIEHGTEIIYYTRTIHSTAWDTDTKSIPISGRHIGWSSESQIIPVFLEE